MISVNNWGINLRVILTAIIPVLIYSFVIGAYINNARNQDLEREQNERGSLIASNLAAASEFPVATRNIDQILVLVDSTINQKDVIGVRIVDESGKQLFKRGSYGGEGKGDISQYSADIVSKALADTDLFEEATIGSTDESKLLLGTVEVYISNESYLIRQKAILGKTIAITLAGVIFSVMFAILVANGVVRPVRDVIEAVTSLTHGNLTIRVTGNAGGDLGKLQSGINAMAETMESSQMRLELEVKDATAELKKTVVELEIKNKELDKTRKEAMKAKDAKTEFLANMSHEIRTPLNAIIGFSRQLDKSKLDKKQQDFTKTINSAARQLLTVIDDILSFSKLESGNLKISRNDFFLRDCFENIVLMMSQSASEKDVELVLLIDADVPDVVEGDKDRMSQVLTNMVTNAIKFTDYGSVIVHVSADEENVLNVLVSDTGCGISDDAQSKLFTPFYQENQHSSKRHGGTGLGLVICQRLITMMGGKLSFESEVGVGSKFSFCLPMKFVSMHDYITIDRPINVFVLDGNIYSRRAIRNNLLYMGFQVFAVDKNKKLINNLQKNEFTKEAIVMVSLPPDYSVNKYFKNFHKEIRGQHDGLIVLLSTQEYSEADIQDKQVKIITKPARLSSLASVLVSDVDDKNLANGYVEEKNIRYDGYNILVAEDNEFNQKYITSLLQGMGFDVTCVDTGNKALDESKRNRFDMILMDLHMPELGGVDATKMIRNLPNENVSIPIIAITADVFANEGSKLLDAGFTDCMFKPIDEDKLHDFIEKHLIRNSKSSILGDYNPDVEDMNALRAIPGDMRERLFSDLYIHFDELLNALRNAETDKAREHVHKILGLVCYFKIDELEKNLTLLHDAVHDNNFKAAEELLVKTRKHARSIQNILT